MTNRVRDRNAPDRNGRKADTRKRPAPNGAEPDERPPFSNYAGSIPLGINEIYASLMEITGGWPKVIGGTLCCLNGDELRSLAKPAALFAWIRTQYPVDWRGNKGRAVPMEQFYECLLLQKNQYTWASAHPHFPSVEGVLYLKQAPVAENTGMLDKLLDRFRPKTDLDRELIRALILTLFWGGAAGQRPQFVIVADPGTDEHGGRGTGKTKLAELTAHLVGGCIDIQPCTGSDRVVTNLLSLTSYPRRVVLVDNLKTLHYSHGQIESIISRSEITGHRLFQGFGMRPNLLVWIVTVNGASFSTDMARRSVVIYLKRPERTSDAWYTQTVNFIDQNREAIIADVRWHLEEKKPAIMERAKEDTWADWRRGVLRYCKNSNELVRRLESRREHIDGDKEDIEDMITHIRACLQESFPSILLDAVEIWIPSRALIQWVQVIKPRYDDRQASTYLKRLPMALFEFAHRRDGNGYWWTGPKFDGERRNPPRSVKYSPNLQRGRGYSAR